VNEPIVDQSEESNPETVLHLREPASDLVVVAEEVMDEAARRRVAVQAWRLQLWYAAQPYSIDDCVTAYDAYYAPS